MQSTEVARVAKSFYPRAFVNVEAIDVLLLVDLFAFCV